MSEMNSMNSVEPMSSMEPVPAWKKGKTGVMTQQFLLFMGAALGFGILFSLYVSKSQWDYVSYYDCGCLRCAVLDAETALHRMEKQNVVFGISGGFAGNCGLQDC